MKSSSLFILLFTFFATYSLEAKTFETEHWQTKNGATVVFYPAMDVPMLEVSVAFAAGSAYDGQQFGLSALTTQMLTQGSGRFNAIQVAEKFADVGAQFNADVSRDMAVLQLKTLTDEKSLQQAIDTLELVLSKPLFPQDAFTREKNQQIYAINHQEESPGEIANNVFFDKLYHDHPYAHSIKGTINSVSALRTYDVRKFYSNYFVASNAVIVLVGAIDHEKAHQLAEQLVAKLPQGQPAPAIPKAKPLTTKERVSINYPSSQTMLQLGQIGIDHLGSDYFALMVGDYILGGGALVSRLSTEIREKRGLTYGVQSQFMPMPGDGPFLISLSTKNKQAAEALKLTESTLANFLETGPSEEELTAAKQYLIGNFPVTLSSNTNIAGMLLRVAFYHLPFDYLDHYTANIAAVTTDDIKQAFNNHIKMDKMLTVSVGAMDSNLQAKR